MIEIEKRVSEYKTKFKEGFTQSEIKDLLKEYPSVNMERFNNALTVVTCLVFNKEVIIYRQDIYNALICGLENRDLNTQEFD